MRLTNNLFKVTLKRGEEAVTGRMGLAWLVEAARVFGLEKMVGAVFGAGKGSNREKGAWEKIVTGIMMMASGGERIEDVEVLRKDRGLLDALSWKDMICADTLINFFRNRRNSARVRQLNDKLVVEAMKRSEKDVFTYDNDATYFDSKKDVATYSYKKRKQMGALLGSIAEIGMINTIDYRRGNVSPQDGILGQLKKAVLQAKRAGKRIERFRSDSAAHQKKIYTYCSMNGINYYVAQDKNQSVMRAIKAIDTSEWKRLHGRYEGERLGTKWAETEYRVSKGFRVRILVLRWRNPDPTLFDQDPYCYHVIGTNDWYIEPMEWLAVHNGRMGTIEQAHKELKNGLGCGYTPSNDFEKDRGYFMLGVLAHNVIQVMKQFYLGPDAVRWTIKTMRYQFINVCGRVVRTGRKWACRIINVTDEMFERFLRCQQCMAG